MCCIVASLVQVILDPYWRSLRGFQTLIQKEWVVLGHPFCTRLAHVFTMESEQVKYKTCYILRNQVNVLHAAR
jgi:myotubularin-related protein 10/11/12